MKNVAYPLHASPCNGSTADAEQGQPVLTVVPNGSESQPKSKSKAVQSYRRVGPFRIEFEHAGRTFTLFKRREENSLPWQIKFDHECKQVFRSCGTNVIDVAIARAKSKIIEPALNGKWEVVEETKAKRTARTSLAQVFAHFDKIALISPRARYTNKTSMLAIFKATRENPALTAADVFTDEVTAALGKEYQRKLVRNYENELPEKLRNDRAALRNVRERALRTSRSTINQARSVFSVQKGYPKEFREAGLTVPECVIEFCKFKRDGKNRKMNYNAPSDEVVQKIFNESSKLRDVDRNAYLCFWLAAGTGARRGEISDMQKKHFRDIDGALWLSGGTGKDGENITLPVQSRAVPIIRARLAELKDDDAFLLEGPYTERYDTTPDNLNRWLRSQGLNETEKGMHEIRAYVGSKIYQVNPLQARDFLRHKSLRITEEFYSRYVRVKHATDVL